MAEDPMSEPTTGIDVSKLDDDTFRSVLRLAFVPSVEDSSAYVTSFDAAELRAVLLEAWDRNMLSIVEPEDEKSDKADARPAW